MLRRGQTAALALAVTVTVGLAAPGAARATGGVAWPAADDGRAGGDADPIAELRWTREEAWLTAHSARATQILAQLDAQQRTSASPARLAALRAVVLRALGRTDDARAALEQAVGVDRRVLEDPDVALTQAYLQARAGRFQDAVATVRTVLPRLESSRAEVVLEVAGWSMARGAEGVADAIALLREVVQAQTPTPAVLAMLTLALHRAGRGDEARAIAHTPPLPHPYDGASARRGAVLAGELDAAVGTTLVLAGHGHDAIEPLVRAAAHVPAPWRASVAETLAIARRAGPVSTAEPTPAPLPVARPLAAPHAGSPRSVPVRVVPTAAPHRRP